MRLGTKGAAGQQVGEWKYWWWSTGHLCCVEDHDDTGTYRFTRYHPDGTWSLKSAYKDGKLDGPYEARRSDHATTELSMSNPLHANVHRLWYQMKGGIALTAKFFDKDDRQIGLDGKPVLTSEQLKAHFAGFEAPDALEKLLDRQSEAGAGNFTHGVFLTNEDKSLLTGYSDAKEFLDALLPFATANGTGSCYAFWNCDQSRSLGEMPIVVIGDEGGIHVYAEKLTDLLTMLSADIEPSVWPDEVSFNFEDYEPSPVLKSFRDWLKNNFQIKSVKSPKKLLKSEQKKYAARFKGWLAAYVK